MGQDDVGTMRPAELRGFVFDLCDLELRDAAGRSVDLRPKSREVLKCLVGKANRVVSKDDLMRRVWPSVVVTEDSLVQCVAELRRALKDVHHDLIRTETRRGYRLVLPPTRDETVDTDRDPSEVAIPRQEIRFTTTASGVRLGYALSGSGPALVRTTHWTTSVESDWHNPVVGPMLQRLSRRFRLLRYDGRGTGLSDRAVLPVTLDDWVGDMEAAVDAAGFERFALLGTCSSGCSAIRYAARHPERVSRLVLAGVFARGRLRRGDLSESLEHVEAMTKILTTGWGRENPAYRQLFSSQTFPEANGEQMQALNQLKLSACSSEGAAAMYRQTSDFDVIDDLARIRCPTLVLHSPRDRIMPIAEGRLCAATIPGAVFETFDSPNHLPLPGEPAFDGFVSRIEAFFLATDDVVSPLTKARVARPGLRDVNSPKVAGTRSRAA
jgi:pimeloyl-ACP methyl ester carboxylesterase